MEEKLNQSLTIRETILDLANKSDEGHIPSSFSIVEIMLAIKKHQERNDIFNLNNFVLSKGHASFGYYAFLYSCGLFSKDELGAVCELNSKFYGHLPYLEDDKRFHYGSGSLGHGLPYAIGMAFAKYRNKSEETIYCVVGDGEANEGTFWESLLILKKFPHLNIKIILDQNSSSERAIPINSFLDNLKKLYKNNFVINVDGHDIDKLCKSLDRGTLIIANTSKGYPLGELMSPVWHHKSPSDDQLENQKKLLQDFYS